MGLSPLHGYNYLMQQVNNAQSAVSGLETANGQISQLQTGQGSANGKITQLESGMDTANNNISQMDSALQTTTNTANSAQTAAGNAQSTASAALPKTEHKQVTPNTEGPMPLWFPVVREWCIDRLQDRRFPLPQRIQNDGPGAAGAGQQRDEFMSLERAGGSVQIAERVGLLPESSGRALLHNNTRRSALRDEFFKNDSATLAHMAILLGG